MLQEHNNEALFATLALPISFGSSPPDPLTDAQSEGASLMLKNLPEIT